MNESAVAAGRRGAVEELTRGLRSPSSTRLSPQLFRELVFHLVKREIDSTHRMTVLGWAWPLVRQLVQLAVLVFIFGSVLDLGIENFPIFVFSGLISWTWFSVGTAMATNSLLSERHLLYQPRLPPGVLPIVAVAVPLVDVCMALPVLGVMLVTENGIPATAVFLPVLIVVQFVLMAGIGWLTSAGSVFFRDIPNLVTVSLTTLFYLTPVFYGLHTVPEKYATVLELNPMATIIDTYRAILIGEPYPGKVAMLYTVGLAAVLATIGYLAFTRVQGKFVDSL